ncbi:MAG: hypothetical protein Q7K37_04730 [Dehalococcoidia bacterium]|nr:hypothetical protein [Dehalococcoidia bacterium]
MLSSTLRRTLLLAGVTLALGLAVACSDDADPTATPTASPATTETTTAVATAPATATTSPTATATPAAGAPAAPTDVVITGRIPDLEEPVPLGEAESGRISITWSASTGEVDGYRIYQEECGREAEPALEVAADELTYGPLNPCRPARVGVAAFRAGRGVRGYRRVALRAAIGQARASFARAAGWAAGGAIVSRSPGSASRGAMLV